jgi:hypothetical protein
LFFSKFEFPLSLYSGIYVKKTRISEIKGGKIDFELRVRVINLWSTPDRNNPGEEGAIHMIFLDERVIC